MTADIDDFQHPRRSYLHRIAISSLALLGAAAILAATLQIIGPAFGAVPLPAAADAAPLAAPADGYEPTAAPDEIPLAEYFSAVENDVPGTSAILDTLFGSIASGCVLFLLFGGWLCLRVRSDTQRLGAPDRVAQSAGGAQEMCMPRFTQGDRP